MWKNSYWPGCAVRRTSVKPDPLFLLPDQKPNAHIKQVTVPYSASTFDFVRASGTSLQRSCIFWVDPQGHLQVHYAKETDHAWGALIHINPYEPTCTVVVTPGPLLALTAAYRAEEDRQRDGFYRCAKWGNTLAPRPIDTCYHYFSHPDKLSMVLSRLTKATPTPDYEYNNIVQRECVPIRPGPRMPKWDSLDSLVKGRIDEIDERVYTAFSAYMRSAIRAPPSHRRFGKSKKIGTHEYGPGENLVIRGRRCDIDFEQVVRLVELNGCPIFCQRMPKFGCTKSDGTQRWIFPTNIMLEAKIKSSMSLNFCDRHIDLNKLETLTRRGLFRLHDVSNCDLRVAPYIARFTIESGLHWLFPMTLDPDARELFYPNHFPSGVPHTSVVTEAFTCAIADVSLCGDYCVSGDAIASELPVQFPGVRVTEDFNGFKPGPPWWYSRGARLGEPKYHRATGPRGINRYVITHRAYTILNARIPEHLPSPDDLCRDTGCVLGDRTSSWQPCTTCRILCRSGRHLHEVPRLEFARAIQEVYGLDHDTATTLAIARVTGEQVGYNFDNMWECAPTQERATDTLCCAVTPTEHSTSPKLHRATHYQLPRIV